MELFNSIVGSINDILYSYVIIVLLLFVGIYFTFRTGFVQFKYFFESIRVLREGRSSGRSVSSFQALMISTASRVGTGNMAGVATAIALGGPGAVFWMWLTAVVGGASAFIESSLAQLYKRTDGNNFRGGPAYYLQAALGSRPLGVLFAISLILCFGYGFNPLQAYNMSSALAYYVPNYYESYVPMLVGLILAVLTGLTIFGGVTRIANVNSRVVPIMAIIYIGMSLIILVKNINILPETLSLIFRKAFDFQSIFGGFAGSAVMHGIKRGLYSNEAGMGSAPNAAATADVSHPASQGIVQMLSVFIDTLLICSATAVILLMSGLEPDGSLRGMPYVQAALKAQFGELGILFVTVSVCLFAFSSLLGNYYYTESNLLFINEDKRLLQVYRWTALFVIFLGPQYQMDTAWDVADMFMGIMTVVHLIPLLLLGGLGLKLLHDYSSKKRAGYQNPTFKASDIGVDNTEWWK